jgi:hypothetical protein
MMIDCDACAARGPACGDCVVTVLLGAPPAVRPGDGEVGIDLDGVEQAALAVLAGTGLIPPLRLVAADNLKDGHRPADHRHSESHSDQRSERHSAQSHGASPYDERPDGSHQTAV